MAATLPLILRSLFHYRSGALPWTAAHERRVALFRFAPATVAYGRSYLSSALEPDVENGGGLVRAAWPSEITDGMTDEQLAVMQPPYAERLDRPILVGGIDGSGGGVTYRSRNKRKKEHDSDVFKTSKYF